MAGARRPRGWLAEAGAARQHAETSNCCLIYYSRYYRQRPGFDLPDGPWFLSPRGDLGYFGYATFPGDNHTFAAVRAVPTGVPQWRVFKDPAAFEAPVARIPALRQWADPAVVDPITGCLWRACAIRSSPATPRRPQASFPSATPSATPILSWRTLVVCVIHAAELAAVLREYDDPGEAAAAYAAATTPALRERYDYLTALDAQRHRMWMGGPATSLIATATTRYSA